MLQGDWTAARPALERAMRASRDAGQPVQLANSLAMASIAANMAGDRESALRRLAATDGARLSRQVGDLYALHMMNLHLGWAALFSGDTQESRARYSEALHIAYQIDDRIGQFYLLAALALHATVEGRTKTAARLLGASETIRIVAGAKVM